MADMSQTDASMGGANNSEKEQPIKTGLIVWCIMMGFVLSFLLSIVEGLRQVAMTLDNQPMSLVVDSVATTETDSHFSAAEKQTVVDYLYHLAPNMVFSPETLSTYQPGQSSSLAARFNVRGVPAEAATLRGAELLEGRWFSPNKKELVVGRITQQQYADLSIGNELALDQDTWLIVGVFSTNNPYFDSEVWGPVVLMPTLQSDNVSYQSVYLPELSDNMHTHLRDVFSKKLTREVNVTSVSRYLKLEKAETYKSVLLVVAVIFVIVFICGVFGARKLASQYGLNPKNRTHFTFQSDVSLKGAIIGIIAGVLGYALAYLLLNGQLMDVGQSVPPQSISIQLTVSICLVATCLTSVMGLLSWRHSR